MALQPTQASPGPFTSPKKHGSPSSHQTLHDKGKKPLHQNRSWVRGRDPESTDDSPNGPDTGRPLSLLSRIKPESPSLLKRIAPAGEEPVTTSLEDRLTDPPQVEKGEGEVTDVEDVDMREAGPSTSPRKVQVKLEDTMEMIPSLTTARRVGMARGRRSTIDVFGEPTIPAVPNEASKAPTARIKEEKNPSPDPRPALVNDTVVDALLATILPSNGTTVLHSSPEPMATTSHSDATETTPVREREDAMAVDRDAVTPGPPPSSISAPATPSINPAVLEQCRNLLIPGIVRLAMRRNPGLDEETAKKRALARLSDEQCIEFLKLAKRMRTEMGDETSSPSSLVTPSARGSRSEAKRTREGEDESGSPAHKRQRQHTPNEAQEDPPGEVTATANLHSTPRPDNVAATLPNQVASLTLETGNVSSHPEGVPVSSREGSATHMSVAAVPSRSPSLRSRHASVVSANGNSRDGHTPLSADLDLSLARSPAPSGRAGSAETNLPSTTTSHSATALVPSPSRSPAPADVPNTFSSRSADASQRRSVTLTPNTTVQEQLPVIQDPSEDLMQPPQDMQEQPQQEEPPTLVPALWAAVIGRASPDVETIQFFVDDATADAARHWTRRKEEFSFEHRHVKVHLLCLSAAVVSEYYQNLPPTATREEIVSAMWNMKTEWPTRGTLIIEPTSDTIQNPWIPDQDSGPLDITHAIARGMNTFRLIQLADMSSKLFVFHATEPSPEERRTVGRETIAVVRTIAKLMPQSPKKHDPLATRMHLVV